MTKNVCIVHKDANMRKFNKIEIVTIILLLFFISFASAVPKEKRPLSLEDIKTLLKSSVSNERITRFIIEYGVNFVLNDNNIDELRSIGADNTLLETIKQASGEYKKSRGSLYVDSKPTRAKVFLDGKDIGLTPLLIEDLSAGEKELKVLKEGYVEYRGIVAIELSKRKICEITLEPLITLTVKTNPPGAKIYLDGSSQGISPQSIKNLNKGQYILKIEKEGYRSNEEKIFLSESKTVEITFGKKTSYLKRSDFYSDEEYGQYIKKTLKPGMRVRSIVEVYRLKKGMTGTYWGTTIGAPPAFVIFDDYLGYETSYTTLKDDKNIPKGKERYAFWVYWYQIEISEPDSKPPEEKRVKPIPPPASTVYETAYNAFKDKKYKEAREQFESFVKEFPNDDLVDDAQFWIGETYYEEKDFEGAILAYETLLKKYQKSEKTPAALLKQGLSFIEIGDKKTGKVLLDQLIERYPNSKEAKLAEKKIEELSEKRTVIKVKQITGDVVTVDAKSNTLKVKGKKGAVIIICDDKTKIMAGNEKKAFEDIEISDKVTVKYTENDGKNVAKSIAIKQAVKKDKNRDEKVEDKSEEKNGWISVMSYPKGTVFINGREMGYTPLSKREIPVGQHEILVRANDNEQKRVVIVRENETVEVSFQFDKAY